MRRGFILQKNFGCLAPQPFTIGFGSNRRNRLDTGVFRKSAQLEIERSRDDEP